MKLTYFVSIAVVATLPFLASCGSSVPVIAKSSINKASTTTELAKVGKTAKKNQVGDASKTKPSLKKEVIAVASPSSKVISDAAAMPRDKHSMPIYKFADRQRVVRTTAYTCSEDDHIVYGNKNAVGTNLRYSSKVRSAAADWSFYPVGTVFRIKGMDQLYVVDDYGSALTGTGTVDLYKPTKGMMDQWGCRNVEISVVQWGSFKRSAKLLKGRTGYSHCRQMLSNILRQRPDLSSVAKN